MKMQNKISFGKWEAVTMLVNLICTKIFLYYPRMTVEDAGTAGWILSLYNCLLVFIIYIVIMKLIKKFEGKDILDIAEIAGGKPLKIFTGLIVFAVLFYLTTAFIRKFSEDMKVVSLPNSPLSYIMVFFIAGVIIGSLLGIEAIVRYSAIIIPVIAAGYIVILLGAAPKVDLTNLLPIMGNGAYSILGKGFFRISIFGELLVLFLLPPFLGEHKNVRTVGYMTIAFSSIFLVAGSLVYIMTFPYPSNMESFLPIYHMARLINLGRFFQRIESVFLFIWAMAAFVYLTATFYFMVYTFAKVAGLRYLRPLIFPFAVLVFSAAFIPQNLMSVIKINTDIFNNTVWIVTFMFTGLIIGIARLRKQAKKEASKS